MFGKFQVQISAERQVVLTEICYGLCPSGKFLIVGQNRPQPFPSTFAYFPVI